MKRKDKATRKKTSPPPWERRLPGAPAALPLIVTLLYLSHPVHTEVVANIKSRDEILAFFFAVVCLYLLIRHSESKSRLSLAASVLAFFAALLAKESIITFV